MGPVSEYLTFQPSKEDTMTNRYEVQESPRNPGKFNVVDKRIVKAVKMGLPEDSAHEEADKLNKLFPVTA